LGGLFIAALVSCNMIANRFIEVDLGFKTFIISAGVLPYPITFLITDILSEVWGRKKTNQLVYAGFAASLFVLGILWSSAQFDAVSFSIITDQEFDKMFGNTWRVVFSSMVAYLTAQLVDVRLFHFWKKLTNGKHLWLRNNASTIFSQLVDTTLVVGVLFIGYRSYGEMADLIVDGWMFKVLVALVDTPFLYLATYLYRRRFGLKFAQEVPG
jgi:uncharacterized integral membrane protein (TIGR00697 family)